MIIISFILNFILLLTVILTYRKLLSSYFITGQIRIENDFLKGDNQNKQQEIENLKFNNEELKKDKYEAEKEKEVALEKVLNSEKLLKNYEENKNQVISHSKAAIFEMAGEISNRLINDHRRETEEAKTQSVKKVEEITKQYQQQFEKIVETVGALSASVNESNTSVNMVKNALLSPSGAGSLAEITLENILKNSGLTEGRDYHIQHTIFGEGNVLRPDAVCLLPSNNILLIDAKASKFFLDANDETRLLQAMKTHLKQLSSRDYQTAFTNAQNKNKQPINHVSTIMFLPSETSLERLQKADNNFLQSAWNLGIYPAGPVGLVNILTHAKFTISENLQVDNYRKIIGEVSNLISSISTIQEHARKVGSSLSSAVNNFDKFSASFNTNLLSKAKNIEKLGITSTNKKTLPSHLERFQLISSSATFIEVEDEEEVLSLTTADE